MNTRPDTMHAATSLADIQNGCRFEWGERGDFIVLAPANQYIETLAYSVAGRCPISVDRLTYGAHPDADKREEGELAIIDWSQSGGEILDLATPEREFIRLVGPLRAIGAAMLAVDKHWPRDLPHLFELAFQTAEAATMIEGGPEDQALRWGMAARAAAMTMLGRPGTHMACADWLGRERSVPDNHTRREAVLPVDPLDFNLLTAIAFCRHGAA